MLRPLANARRPYLSLGILGKIEPKKMQTGGSFHSSDLSPAQIDGRQFIVTIDKYICYYSLCCSGYSESSLVGIWIAFVLNSAFTSRILLKSEMVSLVLLLGSSSSSSRKTTATKRSVSLGGRTLSSTGYCVKSVVDLI